MTARTVLTTMTIVLAFATAAGAQPERPAGPQRSPAERAAAAQAERSATMARVGSAVAEAADRYEVARAQLGAFDAALLRGAREEREAALSAYRTGSMTLLELIDFERALAQAEVTRLRSQLEAADALLDLIAAALGADDLGLRVPHTTSGGER